VKKRLKGSVCYWYIYFVFEIVKMENNVIKMICLLYLAENKTPEVYNGELQLLPDPKFSRNKTSVNMNHALYIYNTDR
jgi:hypothetical protein